VEFNKSFSETPHLKGTTRREWGGPEKGESVLESISAKIGKTNRWGMDKEQELTVGEGRKKKAKCAFQTPPRCARPK